MKSKKKYIYIGIISVLLIVVFYHWGFNKEKILPDFTRPEQAEQTNKDSIIEPVEDKIKALPNEQKEIKVKDSEIKQKEEQKSAEETNLIKVSLNVAGKSYETEVKENSTVFEMMEKLKVESSNANTFDFKYTSHTSLGNFVTEINGQQGTPGKYWIYYVNGKKASVGVSNLILKDGDIINWSQEGF